MESTTRGQTDNHDELGGLFLEAVAEAGKVDRSGLRPIWSGFRRALLLHLEAEELLLIPGFAKEHPVEARALLRDHAFFRAAVDDFEVSLEARLQDQELVQTFKARLDA